MEDVLIKLRRKYSENEMIQALYKVLSEKNIEIGKLKSEIEFLNEELKNKKILFEKELINKIKDSHMWKEQRKILISRGEEIHKLKKIISEHNLKATCNKNI